MKRPRIDRCLLICLMLLLAPVSTAYVGPGAGLSAIGGALALIGALLLGIIGFFWYPIKRLMRKFKTKEG